ncbi:ABC transporter permease [Peptostreptococcus faecalis]|uniref:ABC transporter permease n=1 Tax=Peptostreptococcus faecalis TaxID=2045015 RepID=UPI000C7CE7BA|nr:ABC transporter permease [Peptostreptococcus faecalis]
MNLMFTTIEQGLIYTILGIGVYLTYKVLDIADLSVDSTFPFGALLFARLATLGLNPMLSIVISFVIGTFTGFLAAFLSIKLKIKPLLAGILNMTILYSINLRINGKANVPLSGSKVIFDYFTVGNKYIDRIIVMIIIVAIIKFLVDKFLITETGYMLVATGDNKSLVKSLGESSNKYSVIGLMLSNGLVALSGALLAQSQRYADMQMGPGTIVIALALIIIGDTVFRHRNLKGTTRVLIGAIIYKAINALALEAGLQPSDFKMITGIIVVLFIAYNNSYANWQIKKRSKERA